MNLYIKDWLVPDAKGSVVLIHGTGEHSGRYEHVAEELNRYGYNVYSGDLPGFGQSPGVKGHINRFDEYIEATEHFLNRAIAAEPEGHPIYLLGHSLGGLVVTRFVQTYADRKRLAGVILSSPCLKVLMEVPKWKEALANLLNQVYPTLRVASGIQPSDVMRDQVIQAKTKADPFYATTLSVRWFNELNRAMHDAGADVGNIDIPLLILQAGADRLIDPKGVEEFFERVPAVQKKLVMFPGFYHEIFNDFDRQNVFDEMISWLQEREASLKV
ncbi:alpha/beta hydrolase [Brevibacillus dissolubilis]|uniref:alpha/beta hydrolase n=1 Tax=Brevibacillus dissolubilis TaxID=1844116 RepID=UPI001116A498|nr:alpha/beta hydrolase [Brevibacillus dissolubilis]